MADSCETEIYLSVEETSESIGKENSSNIEAELTNFSSFLRSIKSGDLSSSEIRDRDGNESLVESVQFDRLHNKDDELSRWGGNQLEASNDSVANDRRVLTEPEDSQLWSVTASSNSRSGIDSYSQRMERPIQSNSFPHSKWTKQTNVENFNVALAKLPLVCSSPSSLAHLSVHDMKALLRPTKELNTKISKEDLRYELFLLIQAGRFDEYISKLKKLQQKGGGASPVSGAYDTPGGPKGQNNGTTVKYYVNNTINSNLWENEGNFLVDRPGEAEKGSLSECWERVSVTDEEILESGNSGYFSKRMLSSYIAHRHSSVRHHAESTANKNIPSGNEKATNGSEEDLLYKLRKVLTGLKSEFTSGSENKGKVGQIDYTNKNPLYVPVMTEDQHPLAVIKQSVEQNQGLRLVVFNSSKIGLALQQIGEKGVAVRNKTASIDSSIAQHLRIGDRIVYAAGVDFQKLTYAEKLEFLATKERPLLLGFASSDASSPSYRSEKEIV